MLWQCLSQATHCNHFYLNSNCCLFLGKLGANAILAVSLAVCKAGAAHKVRHFHIDWSIHQWCQYPNLLAHTLPFLQCFCTYHYNANPCNIFLDSDIADLTSCTYTWQAITTGAHDIWHNRYKNYYGCSNDTLLRGHNHNNGIREVAKFAYGETWKNFR